MVITAEGGESVLMTGESSTVVQWLINCKGGKRRDMGDDEDIGRWSLHAKPYGAWRTY